MAEDKPKTLSVKLPMDVVELARIASVFRNESMTDMLGDMLRPALERLVEEGAAKLVKSPKGKAGPK